MRKRLILALALAASAAPGVEAELDPESAAVAPVKAAAVPKAKSAPAAEIACAERPKEERDKVRLEIVQGVFDELTIRGVDYWGEGRDKANAALGRGANAYANDFAWKWVRTFPCGYSSDWRHKLLPELEKVLGYVNKEYEALRLLPSPGRQQRLDQKTILYNESLKICRRDADLLREYLAAYDRWKAEAADANEAAREAAKEFRGKFLSCGAPPSAPAGKP